MAIVDLKTIVNFFKGAELSDAEKSDLFCEALFMTLARATAADTNIAHVEVATVQALMKKETGRDVEAKDVRVEAIQHAFETAPFDKLLSKARSSLDASHRLAIADALAQLIRSDDNVSPFETDFFNAVVKDLGLEPADISKLEH